MPAQAPDHGGRILLSRASVDEDGASYRVELATSDATFEGGLHIAARDGAVSLDAFHPDPPAWLLAQVAPLARTLFRGRREDPALPWPRRLHRWRGPRGERDGS
jgi:hypothetical protein